MPFRVRLSMEMTVGPSPKTLETWLTEGFRYTAFVGQKPALEPAKLFQETFGISPTSESTNWGVQTTTVSASADSISYSLGISPVRIDLIASPDLTNEQIFQRGPIPNLGTALGQISRAKEAAGRFLKYCTTIKRHAFGFSGYLPQESVKAGYQALQSLLPSVTLDIENSSDFTYRINRPRMVNVGGQTLKVNRLSQWQSIMMQLTAHSGQASASVSLGVAYAVKCELDINTDLGLNLDQLALGDHQQAVNLLLELATEILASGDRK